MGLEEYWRKRQFDDTPEPKGKVKRGSGEQRFVVQRHQASRLHYDLRLEINGVLKSWAVPKGPSLNPRDKRLAVHTEDHPLEYLHFKGKIPKGNYGAGEMGIWDRGEFHSLDQSVAEAYRKGHLRLLLKGQRLKGEFTLLKGGKEDNHWLLIKQQDHQAASGIYDAEDWPVLGEQLQDDLLEPIAPMLATLAKESFNDPDWIYEYKWDGYRMLAHLQAEQVRLYSRNGHSFNQRFAAILPALEAINHQVILDGELVLLDKQGRVSFQGLQNYPEQVGALHYYVFDLLHLNGHSTIGLKLLERKELLRELLPESEHIHYCSHQEGLGKNFYKQAIEQGMEGVMAKKKDASYHPGLRSDSWLKIKSRQTQEAIVAGYLPAESGGGIKSLVLAVQEEGKLRYIGNCGSGLGVAQEKPLRARMNSLKQKISPFEKAPSLKGQPVQWLQPQLVVEVAFSEWTQQGRLRHPVYKGLREDRSAEEVAREEASSSQSAPADKKGKQHLEVEGISLPLSNLEKLYWPAEGLRKYELIDYYIKVADHILPHLKDRPQSLHRHPDGIQGDSFYQKDQPDILPHWLETVKLKSQSAGREIQYLLCQNQASLLYMANLGCIEINPWNSRVGQLDQPDYSVIDLDPSPENSFEEVIEVAQAFQALLQGAKIPAYCKTSGSSGLHIYLPLAAQYSYEQARDFTKLLCHHIQQQLPKLSTLERSLRQRKGRIYLDYLQNRRGQTLASAYCLRPRIGAPVSAPLEWDELKTGLQIVDFNIHNMPTRLAEKGDLFLPVLTEGFNMSDALDRLSELEK